MNAEESDISGRYHRLDGGGVSTLLPVEGDEPPRAAVLAVLQPKVAVDGDPDGGVVSGFVEDAEGAVEGALVCSAV